MDIERRLVTLGVLKRIRTAIMERVEGADKDPDGLDPEGMARMLGELSAEVVAVTLVLSEAIEDADVPL